MTTENNNRDAGKSIRDIDQNFRSSDVGGKELSFVDPFQEPFEITGLGWWPGQTSLCRLPEDMLKSLPENLTWLAWCTTGVTVRFRTNATTIAVSAKLTDPNSMPHMPLSGSHGVDLYLGAGEEKTFRRNARPGPVSDETKGLLADDLEPTMRDATLYLPLYTGVQSLSVGLTPGCEIAPPTAFRHSTPVVFYGSSITHGGCASRPGTSYPAFLGRWLDADIINLGFSGNAKGEPEVARLLATLDMSVFVMDYDHNAQTVEYLQATHEPFFRMIREARPDLPVVFSSRPNFDTNPPDAIRRRDVIRATYEHAKNAGDQHVYFVDGENHFGEFHRAECTVDACHPTDLGFYRMAENMAPVLREALQGRCD